MVVLLTFGWKRNNIMYCSVINLTASLKEFLVFSGLTYRVFSNTT
jgi:hypothetical protein